jgi:hypothetical protein
MVFMLSSVRPMTHEKNLCRMVPATESYPNPMERSSFLLAHAHPLTRSPFKAESTPSPYAVHEPARASSHKRNPVKKLVDEATKKEAPDDDVPDLWSRKPIHFCENCFIQSAPEGSADNTPCKGAVRMALRQPSSPRLQAQPPPGGGGSVGSKVLTPRSRRVRCSPSGR